MNAEAVLPYLPAGVSRETLQRLDRFAALFESWSTKVNLVASSTTPDFWTRHVADSAQLVDLKPDATRWADLGSGGGFPGLVVAILLSEVFDAHVDLIESNRKKAAFLQTVRAECAPKAAVHAKRIEEVIEALPAPEIVIARALAPLSDLLCLAESWWSDETIALFHKGRGYENELAECRAHWDFDLIEHDSRIAADSVVLELSHIKRLQAQG